MVIRNFEKIKFMSVAEMKQKAISLIDKVENEKKLEQVLKVLADVTPRQLNADEAFERTAEKYGETLRKLAQ